MKKLMTIFGVLIFASMIMVSCTQKPEDIKVSDLQTACDHLDAMEKVIDAGIKILDNRAWEDLSEEDKAYIEVLEDKLGEIFVAADKKFTEAEARECPSFERIEKKLEKAERGN